MNSLCFDQVYPNELECQPEFDGFSEWLQTFDLYRGKKSDEDFEDENRVVGRFKVNFLKKNILFTVKLSASRGLLKSTNFRFPKILTTTL